MEPLDFTHDPGRRSFLTVADDSSFPIQNLPWGVFRRPDGSVVCGTRIGDYVVDLTRIEQAGLLPGLKESDVFASGTLNRFAALGRPAWQAIRRRVSELLDEHEPRLRDDDDLRSACILPIAEVEMLLPMAIGDYTDFYSSREHATNVGTMFRGKDNALQPNWLYLPVGYHGRASSVVVSGTPVRRPVGQTRPDPQQPPVFGPSRAVDFELEMGVFIGPGNRLGEPIPIAEAEEHLFGLALVNDWSARDIQRWEYVPLGPFLAKNFATSISPWIVSLEALEPFRCAGPAQEPEPLEYLRSPSPEMTFDIELEVWLECDALEAPFRLCRSNFKYLYWSMAQQVAHHTITGCNLRPGDLLASGTISGSTPDSFGSMLELAWRGERPIELPDGSRRTMLQDGDRITMRAVAVGKDYRIGLGDVTGELLPAIEVELEDQ